MEQWQLDNRRDVVMVNIDQLVPKDHLLRKIEKVMDYDWLRSTVRNDGAPQPVKEVSQICELFGIIGEKENRRGKKNGTVAAG